MKRGNAIERKHWAETSHGDVSSLTPIRSKTVPRAFCANPEQPASARRAKSRNGAGCTSSKVAFQECSKTVLDGSAGLGKRSKSVLSGQGSREERSKAFLEE